MKTLGAKSVVKVSRTKKDGAIDYQEAKTKKDTQVIFNATPAGMYPSDEGCPIDLSVFDNLEGVLDAIYPFHQSRFASEREGRKSSRRTLYARCAGGVRIKAVPLKKH